MRDIPDSRQALERVRRWYKTEMDYDLPEILLVDVHDDDIRDLNDYAKNLAFMANTLPFYRDLEIASWVAMVDKRLQERYGRGITEEERNTISTRVASQLDSSMLPNAGSNPYNTVFVLPRARKEVPLLHDPEDYLEYVLSHEAFHIVQYERGFAGKYPFCSEQTAIFVSMDYDKDKRLFRRVESGNARVDQDMLGGIGVIMDVLKEVFGIKKDPLGLLDEVKMLLDERCYRTVNYYTFGRLVEPRLITDR
ncbi:MAG: hypothetical protein HYW22_00355 [Candidatus Aenigmarchaeota archaeon]|nr:hypothetical protein [Candidatus Aenigmarchaeota archaeon]